MGEIRKYHRRQGVKQQTRLLRFAAALPGDTAPSASGRLTIAGRLLPAISGPAGRIGAWDRTAGIFGSMSATFGSTSKSIASTAENRASGAPDASQAGRIPAGGIPKSTADWATREVPAASPSTEKSPS